MPSVTESSIPRRIGQVRDQLRQVSEEARAETTKLQGLLKTAELQAENAEKQLSLLALDVERLQVWPNPCCLMSPWCSI